MATLQYRARRSRAPHGVPPIFHTGVSFALLGALALSFVALLVCFSLLVRWNKRHGRPLHSRFAQWPEYEALGDTARNRGDEARRLIRHRETTHDPELAGLVLLYARHEQQQWENPWTGVYQSVLGFGQFFMMLSFIWLPTPPVLTFLFTAFAVVSVGFAVSAPTRRARFLERSGFAIAAHEPIAAGGPAPGQEG